MRANALESATGPSAAPVGRQPEDFADGSEKFAKAGVHPVLVVDDDSLVRWAIGEGLKDAGYQMIEASTLCSALRVLGSDEPALVFIDATALPDALNLQELEEMRRQWPRVPIILMCDNDTGEVCHAAAKLGNIRLLKKPVDMAKIGSIAHDADGVRSVF
jgi:DNA-binding NtrC family response regulator